MKRRSLLILGSCLGVFICIGLFWASGKVVQKDGVSVISKKDALKDYDYMWELLDNNYPLKNMAERRYGLSMEALKENYRGQIKALEGDRVDFCQYYELVRECIGKFHALAHLEVFTPYSYYTAVADLEASKRNGMVSDTGLWRLELYSDPKVKERYDYLAEKYEFNPNGKSGAAPNLTFKIINEDTAYVKINSFKSTHIQEDQGPLTDFFMENDSRKNIIIDITGNGGGSDGYWINLIVAPNINEVLTDTSYYITPYGKESREQFALKGIGLEDLNPNLEDLLALPKINEADLQEVKYYRPSHLSISPAYPDRVCDGRFFLLVDDGVYSAADGFALFCKSTGFATIVGENTAGDGGGVEVFKYKLPESNLILSFRAMHGLNADGSSNVEYGTTPDVPYSGQWGSRDASPLAMCLDYIDSLDH